MKKVAIFVAFVAGAAAGSAATWLYTKKKYEQIAQEEIDSVKEAFGKRKPDGVLRKSGPTPWGKEKEEDKPVTDEKPNVAEYAKKLSKEGYTDYSKLSADDEEDAGPPSGITGAKSGDYKEPYVISPEDFRSLSDYDYISLTYFADHILADENDEPIEDVEGTVGFDSLNHFGEYEDDSVFVRNERLKTDFEILMDLRKWDDVIKSKPYLRRD